MKQTITDSHSIVWIVSSDSKSGAKNVSASADYFEAELQPSVVIPKNSSKCELEVVYSTIPWAVPNITTGHNILTLTSNATGTNTSTTITVDPGLYVSDTLNKTIDNFLVNAGVPTRTLQIKDVTATQKVSFALQAGYALTFGDTSPYTVLGCTNTTRFPADAKTFTTTLTYFMAPNEAQYNTISSFLLHSDLIRFGMSFSNYTNIVSQQVINGGPGSTLIFEPYQPTKLSVPHLIGSEIKIAKFWITDQNNNSVDMTAGVWSMTVKITFTHPHQIE